MVAERSKINALLDAGDRVSGLDAEGRVVRAAGRRGAWAPPAEARLGIVERAAPPALSLPTIASQVIDVPRLAARSGIMGAGRPGEERDHDDPRRVPHQAREVRRA